MTHSKKHSRFSELNYANFSQNSEDERVLKLASSSGSCISKPLLLGVIPALDR